MPKRAPIRRLGVCVISSHALALEELAKPLDKPAFRTRLVRFEELSPPDAASSGTPFAANDTLPAASAYVLDSHAPRPITESRIADLLTAHPEARLIVAGEKFSEVEALSLLRLGVRGLVSYKEARDRLGDAVRSVAGGGYWVPRAWLGKFVDSVVAGKGGSGMAAPLGRVAGARARMSRREQQVLDGLLENLANKEIASRLNISERTVKFHVSNLLSKFGVRRRADLILLTFQSGALPPRPA
jgi:DNA-binding NarL/FixJ family response regulator